MELALNMLPGGTSANDGSSDRTSIIDWDDLPVLCDNEGLDKNIDLLKNDGVEEGSTPIKDHDDTPIKPDNDADSDIAKEFDRLNIDTVEEPPTLIQDQGCTRVESKEHANKDIAEDTDHPKKDCMEKKGFKAKLKEHEEAIKSSNESSDDEEFDWYGWANFVLDNLDELRKGSLNVMKHTMAIEDRVDRDFSKFKAEIQAMQDAQESTKAEIEGVKATLEEYAKENESLKDAIGEQESKITALMDENRTFKQQIGSLLYTTRLLEDKMDRLGSEVKDLATL
ncbi:hypothetical protein EIK77_009082 [Talaromyces pinophilus]|nr:hypothetical protein EIK77_009082 [Talaromyces pinophilus]PCG98664.1 Hypothetical protein PENO1_057040 [Penicillium occitanis (nom. inval.)]PCH05656.1 hypothetical protein PENOC_027740 [Penicillium occitanis (nom. inval.)]